MDFENSIDTETHGQGEATGGLSQGGDMRAYLANLERESKTARAEASATREQLQKIASAFGGKEEEDERDPTEALLDQILEAAYESEKAGQGGMPFTVQLAQQLALSQKQIKQMNAALAEIRNKNQQLSNPDQIQDQQAYIAIDNLIAETITDRFGDADPELEKAVANKLVAEIQDLQKKDRDAWQKVRKSPRIQQRMVEHFVENSIPRHLRAMEREAIDAATPVTLDEVNSAKDEAMRIPDPALRAEALKVVREQMWELQFSRRGRR